MSATLTPLVPPCLASTDIGPPSPSGEPVQRNRGPYVQLYTGTQWHFFDPRPEDVRFTDMIGLARITRYLGATGEPYVVAEHAVRVARCLEAWGCDRDVCLAGLLHDPEHIPPGDLPGPMVRALAMQETMRRVSDPNYEDPTLKIRRDGERAVWTVLGVIDVFDDLHRAAPIWKADRVLLATERRDLMAPSSVNWGALPDPLPERILPWTMERAWGEFCAEFDRLGGRRV